jgi:hypothetical protein
VRQSARAPSQPSFREWASLRDLVTGLLAVAIGVFTGAVLWAPLTSGAPDAIQRAQAVMALLGPILGAVVGYYFGTASGERVAQQASQRASEAIVDKLQTEDISNEQLSAANAVIEQARQLLLELQTMEQPFQDGDDDRREGEAEPDQEGRT